MKFVKEKGDEIGRGDLIRAREVVLISHVRLLNSIKVLKLSHSSTSTIITVFNAIAVFKTTKYFPL